MGRENSDWGRRTTKGVLPEDIEVWASLQPVFKCLWPLLAQRARRSSVCPARRRARRTVSALLDVAMQSAFQEKFSYTMTVRGLLDRGSVTVCRVRAFAVANEMVEETCRWRWQQLVCPCDLEPR